MQQITAFTGYKALGELQPLLGGLWLSLHFHCHYMCSSAFQKWLSEASTSITAQLEKLHDSNNEVHTKCLTW